MFFEINNLYKIQNKYDTDRANLLQEQRDSFKNIIKQVNDSRNNEQINASNLLTRQENLFGTITGGDSFCYLIMHFLQPDTWTPFLITKGQHPLYDVSMSIVDLEKFNLIKNKPNLTFEELFSNYTTINIGNLVPAFAFPLWNQKIKLSPGPMHAYAINFFGRNGIWSQKIIIKKNSSGLWIQAIQVLRKDGDKNKVLFEMIPKEFQTDKNGKINWTEY
jgi:hypothetical protein